MAVNFINFHQKNYASTFSKINTCFRTSRVFHFPPNIASHQFQESTFSHLLQFPSTLSPSNIALRTTVHARDVGPEVAQCFTCAQTEVIKSSRIP